MKRPKILVLFCGAGGGTVGYARAGWDAVGVDIMRQKTNPAYWSQAEKEARGVGDATFSFIQADVMEFVLDLDFTQFDAIHASPPCQTFSITANLARAQGKKASSIDLLTPIRPIIQATGLPYVIENVEHSPLQDPVKLCGSTFGLGVRRHRLFESNVPLRDNGPCRHEEQGRPIGVYGSKNDDIPRGGRTARTLEEGQRAMGIDWMPWARLIESVPPVYLEHIGRQLIEHKPVGIGWCDEHLRYYRYDRVGCSDKMERVTTAEIRAHYARR